MDTCDTRANPATQTFTKKAGAFARLWLPRNFWFRRWIWLLDKILCMFTCEGEIFIEDATVTTSILKVRDAREKAKKTIVINEGNQDVKIYENSKLLCIVNPTVRKVLPNFGKMEIQASVESGTCDIQVITYEKCNCGLNGIPGFILFLCLDETGSIGSAGAARGVEIIDEFRNAEWDKKLVGVGYVSFGDIMCQIQPISTDIDAVRALLQGAVDGTNTGFFGDGGGDEPENGVDALAVALNQILLSDIAQSVDSVYIFLKTDTQGYAHNVNLPEVVNTRLNSALVTKTWMEFANTGDGEGTYAGSFPETSKVTYGDFLI